MADRDILNAANAASDAKLLAETVRDLACLIEDHHFTSTASVAIQCITVKKWESIQNVMYLLTDQLDALANQCEAVEASCWGLIHIKEGGANV